MNIRGSMRRAPAWVCLAVPSIALVLLPAVGRAAGPVALVESVTGTPTGIDLMDYLSAGQFIALRAKEGLVIDYLRSCLREVIVGGTVQVGSEQSAVKGGSVERERTRCDGGRLNLTPEQSAASAGTVFRVPPKSHSLPPGTVIERRLYGASPIVDLNGANQLTVRRLDRDEEPLVIAIAPNQLARGRFYDFAVNGKSLSPGGVYSATTGDRSTVFQIDRTAKPGNAPVVSRLLRL